MGYYRTNGHFIGSDWHQFPHICPGPSTCAIFAFLLKKFTKHAARS
jgi:hypothetical protein